MRPIVTDGVAWSVCLSVCLSLQKRLKRSKWGVDSREPKEACVIACTLAPSGEYVWTVHVPRRCGLMSNYFDHLLLLESQSFPIRDAYMQGAPVKISPRYLVNKTTVLALPSSFACVMANSTTSIQCDEQTDRRTVTSRQRIPLCVS